MDMMAWRDLDLYIVGNDTVSAQWFALQQAVCDALQPVKAELLHEHGKLFLGLETEVTGTRWNVDIWARTARPQRPPLPTAHTSGSAPRQTPRCARRSSRSKAD